jgi:hypothetical protein
MLIYAGSAMLAEAKAMREGLALASAMGLKNLIPEVIHWKLLKPALEINHGEVNPLRFLLILLM